MLLPICEKILGGGYMIIYTVKNGDNLYDIATRLGADAELIARDNELADPASLTVGQTLLIRTPQTVHTAADGENLYTVAQSYGVTTNQLWRNNPDLGGKTTLTAGEQIVISDAPPIYNKSVATNAYVYPTINRDTLTKTLPYLTYLTIFSYGVEEDGELTDIDDSPTIELARQYGVAPIMLISNLSPEGNYSPDLAERILSSRALQDILVGEIIRTVTEKRYSGVTVDFEYVPQEYAKEYAEFLGRLDEKLGSGGYPLWVSLAPKTEDGQTGMLYEGHDYGELGTADKALLQTYEWGYIYGPPMAIAPIDKVREVVGYATGKIAPEKLFIGTPNYGYDWTLPFVGGESRATPLGNTEALSLASDRRAAIEYDTVSQAPNFGYFVRDNGVAVEHRVWFQDARSVEATLKLIDEFGLYGISVWNAMRYFPQLWLLLNGTYNIEKILL